METRIFAYAIAGASLILSLYSWIFMIVVIYEDHKEYGNSIKKCISNNINDEFFLVNVLLTIVFIISLFGIRAAGTEYQKTTICNVEINNDNTLYKYKVTKYDEIEYRTKRLNGEWKENSQRIEKTRPEVIYTDDVSDYDVKNK